MTPDQLAAWLSHPARFAVERAVLPDGALDAADALIADGRAMAWPGPDGSVYLSLDRARAKGKPAKVARRPKSGQRTIAETDLPDGTPRLDRYADPGAATAQDACVAWEERTGESAGDDGVMREAGLPRPSIFLMGCRAWDSVERRGADCPACRGRKLRASVYCGLCDRWGLDHRIPKQRARKDPPKEVAAGTLAERRAKRKAKRKAVAT